MFKNTGDLSFYLGISFIVLALIGLLSTFVLVARTSIDQAKLDKLIEVGKWFIVSVAIVIGSTIVSDSFREREQDVKELEVFDKYVSTITEADGIEKRWLLAEYFSFVAPPGELRKSWEAYKATIKPRLDEYREDKAKLSNLASKDQPSETDKQEITHLKNKTEALEKSLVSQSLPVKTISEEWLIIAGGDSTLEAARDELNKAKKVSPDARIYKKGNQFRTVIPNFLSRDEAIKRLPEVKRVVNADAYINVLKNWCTSVQENGDYLVCN
jgi:hypothetical protein